MVHRIERLAIWLTTTVGGIGLLYIGMTAPADTPSVLLGIFYVLGSALLVVGIFGFASEIVVAVHGHLPGSDSTPRRRPKPPTRTIPSGVAASAPAGPFSQPQDRVFVPASVTPLYLARFFEGHTDAQGKQSVAGYVGTWMRIDGPVANVQVFDTSAAVTLYVERADVPLALSIGMWFQEPWKEQVRLRGPNDRIVAVGRIASVSKFEIELRDCEIVE